MADGTTVDSLQIEIEASSAEAKKKVDALAAALERLKKATTRFGNISDRIKQIGAAASDTPAAAKTRQRRQALDRAVDTVSPSRNAGFSADKISRELSRVDKEIEKTEKKILSLQNAFESSFNPSEKGDLSQQLDQYGKLQDELDAQRRTILKSLENASASSPAATDLEKKVEALENVKERVRASLSDGPFSTMRDETKSSGLAYGLESLRIGFAALGNIAPTAAAKVRDAIKSIDLKSFWDQERGAANESSNLAYGLDSLRLGFVSLISPLKNLAGLMKDKISGGFSSIKSLSLQSLIPKVSVSGVKVLEVAFGGLKDKMKILGQTAASTAQKGLELLASSARNLASALKNLATSGIGKAVSGLKSLASSIGSKFTSPFKNAIGAFSKWKSAIGRVAFYRTISLAIRAITDGLKTGMDNLYQYSRMVGTEFAPAMNSLATSAQYLKNSLGAMAAPLIQALAPVVDMLTEKFVALLNVIGKVFAMLTGKTVYTQAKKQAVEYGEAANKASKATKDFLLGIDELNVISKDTGGGVGGADYGSMFEEVEIPVDQLDWVKDIRDAIEGGEWRVVGELVAKKLNDIIDGWDSYAWGQKLGELINNGLNVAYGFLTTFDFEKFGSKVADGLNGLFDTVDWDLLGRTFAAKWNALFDFIYGFATTLKWHEIGLDIAEAINGFLDELDPSKAARAVSTFVTGLFDMLNTAIAETHWDVLGEKLGQFISEVDWQGAIYGALSVITNSLAALKNGIDGFLRSWNWQDTAQQTYTAVNQAFSDVDWSGLGTTLSNAFVTAFNFLRETIEGIEWENIGHDVAAFLNGINWDDLLSGIATTIASAFNAVVSTLSTLVQDLEWEEVGRAVGNAINDFFAIFDFSSFFTGLGNLVSGILSGLSTAIETVEWDKIVFTIVDSISDVDWVGLSSSIVDGLFELLGAAVEAVVALIVDLPKILMIGAEIVAGILKGIVDAIIGLPAWLKEHLVDPIVDGVKNLFGIHSPSTVFAEIGGNLISGLLEGIGGAWGGIVEFFGGKVESLKEFFSGAWENIKTTASEKWEKIKTDLGTVWDKITGGAKDKFEETRKKVSEAWENVKKDIPDKWKTIKENLITKYEEIRDRTKDKFEEVRGKVSDAWDSIKNDVPGKFESIKTAVSSAWGNIVESARSWGSDLCDNLARGIESGIKWVKNAVSSVAGAISDFLHFSEPDIGPLSNFHTYMPDMLGLMAKGIKDNSYLAVNAASDLADTMSKTLGNIEPVEPKFSNLPNQGFSFSTASIQGRAEAPNYSMPSDSGAVGSDNSDLINAFYSAAGMIVEAIQNQDNDVYLDGKQLMQSVERSQRQRGVNIMGGGVNG